MGFYDEMATTARELLAEFGADVPLQRTSAGTFDPVTGKSTGDTTTELTATGLQKRFRKDLVDGKRVQRGDKLYILDDSQVPQMSDKVKVGSEYWNIVDIDTVEPAGTPLVFFVHVRK